MGRSVSYRPAEPGYADELVEHIRPLDLDEVEAASGKRVNDTVRQSIRLSIAPGAAFDQDDRLLALFGAVPAALMGDEAVPWMLGTTRLSGHPGALVRGGARYIEGVRRQYPRLFNYADARNLPSIRWLKRLGFTIDPAEPYGVSGLPFHRFHIGY